jgi:hypothetical protein
MKTITHRDKPTPSLRSLIATLLLAIVCPFSGAAQNDFFPTDYVALPDGGLNIAAYAAHQTLTGPWANGARTAPGELTTNLLAVRVSRHFSVGEKSQYTLAPVMVLTAADTNRNTTLSALGQPVSGFGDLRLGAAFWPYVDRANREYVLTGVFVSLPTGDYQSSQRLNIGENRIKTVLVAGWMKTLGERWVLDLAPEVAFFGDNKRYAGADTLSQDTAYALTGTARYKATPSWHWYGSAQINRGGATRREGTITGTVTGAPENTRLALGTLLFTGENSQIQLRYAQDVEISNGFRNARELVLRWSVVFR